MMMYADQKKSLDQCGSLRRTRRYIDLQIREEEKSFYALNPSDQEARRRYFDLQLRRLRMFKPCLGCGRIGGHHRDCPNPEGMDSEVVPLFRILNYLPGIHTTESCCGHGREPFQIWIHSEEKEPRGLFILARSMDRRYWQYGGIWSLQVSVSDLMRDNGDRPTVYMMESQAKGAEAYAQARDLVLNIASHLDHDGFIRGFGLSGFRRSFRKIPANVLNGV